MITHYERRQRKLEARKRPAKPLYCRMEPTCPNKAERRGLCRRHYNDPTLRKIFGLPRYAPRFAPDPPPPPEPRSPMENAFRFLLALERRHFGWTVAELAEELEVSDQSIYRWVREAEAAGVPLVKVDDRYRLA